MGILSICRLMYAYGFSQNRCLESHTPSCTVSIPITCFLVATRTTSYYENTLHASHMQLKPLQDSFVLAMCLTYLCFSHVFNMHHGLFLFDNDVLPAFLGGSQFIWCSLNAFFRFKTFLPNSYFHYSSTLSLREC